MKRQAFKSILTDDGWLDNVAVETDESGLITDINPVRNGERMIDGFAVPGFINSHSHAFQYAMAGLAERQVAGRESDDFWSWRENMYRVALEVDPEEMRVIATMLYREMRRRGFTSVVEFQYLHHDKDGTPYADSATMAIALLEAAAEAGIKITLTPVMYCQGGFGRPATERQRRFISKNVDEYLKLVEATKDACVKYSGSRLGVGVHSLRAVNPKDLQEVVRATPQDAPFHLHASEQIKEVEECVATLQARPVEWLLSNLELSSRFSLVHATHMVESETLGLAQSGAVAVLCPSTEASLGDGVFPLRKYISVGGRWSIGTDSHIGIDPVEELRLLDSFQRLETHRRDTFPGDPGRFAILESVRGGALSDGSRNIGLRIGAALDACVFKASTPLLSELRSADRASTLILASGAAEVMGTFVSGNYKTAEPPSAESVAEFSGAVQKFRS